MFPDSKAGYYRILSVLDLEWGKKRAEAPPRGYHALSFRIKGNAVFESRSGEVRVGSEEIVFVPKGCGYMLDAESDERLFVVHFDTDREVDAPITPFKVSDPALYEELFKRLYKVWERKETGYRFAAASIFYRILETLSREEERLSAVTGQEKLVKVLEYLHKHYTDPTLSVSSLAELYGCSTTYFRRIFERHCGALPLQYLNTLRLKRAEELIRSGYYTVSQAAVESGFSDVKYFSRLVKKMKGDTPSRLWRE